MERLREVCLRAAKLFDCDYCGIDVGWREDKKDWVIFEVNRTAQFKYFEKRTGVNVAAKMLYLYI
jgi:glutathione synthase/RimK-type ligase-like ATP-grasp enzyme